MAGASYLIALGSNRVSIHGSPAAALRVAIAAVPGRMIAVAPTIATPPLGPSRRRYANCAAIVESPLPPPDMLKALKAVERRMGRRGGQRWGTRVIDLDIILWSGGRWRARDLIVPHPAFRQRDFVLRPAAAIARQWRDPITGLTIGQLAYRNQRG